MVWDLDGLGSGTYKIGGLEALYLKTTNIRWAKHRKTISSSLSDSVHQLDVTTRRRRDSRTYMGWRDKGMENCICHWKVQLWLSTTLEILLWNFSLLCSKIRHDPYMDWVDYTVVFIDTGCSVHGSVTVGTVLTTDWLLTIFYGDWHSS